MKKKKKKEFSVKIERKIKHTEKLRQGQRRDFWFIVVGNIFKLNENLFFPQFFFS